MEAIEFEEVNAVLKAQGCNDLPAHYNGENIIFCWKLSLWERAKLLFTGRIWHLIWSRQCVIQPVCLTVEKPFEESTKKKENSNAKSSKRWKSVFN